MERQPVSRDTASPASSKKQADVIHLHPSVDRPLPSCPPALRQEPAVTPMAELSVQGLACRAVDAPPAVFSPGVQLTAAPRSRCQAPGCRPGHCSFHHFSQVSAGQFWVPYIVVYQYGVCVQHSAWRTQNPSSCREGHYHGVLHDQWTGSVIIFLLQPFDCLLFQVSLLAAECSFWDATIA